MGHGFQEQDPKNLFQSYALEFSYLLRVIWDIIVNDEKRPHTDGNTVIKTMVNPRMIPFVLGFEFIFT